VSTNPSAPEPNGAGAVSLRALTIGLCMTVVAIAFESIAVATAMPVAARDLDGLDYYAWAFSLFLIGMLFSTVVTGRLADRIGPAQPAIVGLLVFTAGLIVAGTAQSMAVLVVGRLIQGLGSGAMNTAAFVIIAKEYDVRRRPRMFTYISTAWVVPAFVGPPIAAWLTHTLSWHWVFFAVLPLVALGGAMSLPTFIRLLRNFRPAAEPSATRPAPMWAAALVAAAAAALQLAGQRLDLWSLPLLVAGLAGIALGLPRLMPAGFFRIRRGISSVIWVRVLLPGAFFGAESFIPLMLVEQRGIELILAGVTLTIGAVGWTTGSWLQSQSWLQIRRDRLITLGTISVTVGIAIVGLLAALPQLWFGLVGLGWIFAGFGMGLATASTSLAVMTLSPLDDQGRNAASLNLGDALGSSVFVGISGSIFAALHDSGNLILTFATVMAAMSLVGLFAIAASRRVGLVRDELGG
jgi:MFS family permease